MTSHSTRAYYEQYWDNPQSAPPANDPTTEERKRMLRHALRNLAPGSPVLDAGCGAGDFCRFLASLGHHPVGLDLSEKAIAFARKQHPDLDFRAGSADDFADEFSGRFQAVWCSEVIEHVFDTYSFLSGLHQCMASGGLLILTTPYHGVLKNLLITLTNYHSHYRPFGGHIRFFDRRSLDYSLRYCGFTPVAWSGVGRFWPLYKSFFVVSRKTHGVQPPPQADF